MRWLLACVAVLVGACGGGGDGGSAAADERPGAEELTVASGDVRLRVLVSGEDDGGPTVVAVNGGPGLSLEAMQAFDRLEATGRRVVRYDQRGSGRSSAPRDGDFGLAAQVEDLDRVRRAVGAERVELVGQSWGGAVAAAYAATHPERVEAVVLLGAVPLDRAEFLAGQQRFRARVVELQGRGLVADPLPPGGGASCLPSFEALLPAYVADPTVDADSHVTSCTTATSRATYEQFAVPGAVEPFAEDLARYEGRVLVMMGEADPFGLSWLERIRDAFSGADVTTSVVERAGHLVVTERRERALAEVAAFLDGDECHERCRSVASRGTRVGSM